MTAPSCSGSTAGSRPGGYLISFQSGCYARSRQKSRPAGTPGHLPSRLPGQPGRSAPAHNAGSTAAPCPVTAARARRAAPAGSSAVSPWCRRPGPDPDPITDQARQRKAHPPAAPVSGGRSRSRPPAAAVADLSLRRPASDPQQQQPRRRRPVPDRVRRDLTHRDNEIIRPARRQARPHRPPRRNPAQCSCSSRAGRSPTATAASGRSVCGPAAHLR